MEPRQSFTSSHPTPAPTTVTRKLTTNHHHSPNPMNSQDITRSSAPTNLPEINIDLNPSTTAQAPAGPVEGGGARHSMLRANVEIRSDGPYICLGEHEKHEPCVWQKLHVQPGQEA